MPEFWKSKGRSEKRGAVLERGLSNSPWQAWDWHQSQLDPLQKSQREHGLFLVGRPTKM